MKTKEAIGLIRLLRDVLYDAYSIGKTYIGGTEGFERNINDIIELLQQGEKFEKMWGKLRTDNYYHYREMQYFLDELEQKYFPKEAKDYPEGEE